MRLSPLPFLLAIIASVLTPVSVQAAEMNDFTLNLFKNLNADPARKGKNLLVSPYSISSALTMTVNGAAGDTRKSMIRALCLGDATDEKINSEAASRKRSLSAVGGDTKLSIANGLFVNKEISFRQPFLDACKKSYGASLERMDFAKPEAVKTINSWVSKNTGEKIPKIIDKTKSDDVAFIINAIYLKARWLHPFAGDKTSNWSFNLADGTTKQVRIMNMKRQDFSYLENQEFQAINLPYKDNRLSLYIFLPGKETTLSAFENGLTSQKLDSWLGQFKSRKGALGLPKFKIEDRMTLKQPLSKMGMTLAFSPDKADFTRMTSIDTSGGKRVYIDDVIHNNFMKVDEEGTEAAAATVVKMALAMARMEPDPGFLMVVDRPFLILLRDKETGANLFFGHINNPGQ